MVLPHEQWFWEDVPHFKYFNAIKSIQIWELRELWMIQKVSCNKSAYVSTVFIMSWSSTSCWWFRCFKNTVFSESIRASTNSMVGSCVSGSPVPVEWRILRCRWLQVRVDWHSLENWVFSCILHGLGHFSIFWAKKWPTNTWVFDPYLPVCSRCCNEAWRFTTVSDTALCVDHLSKWPNLSAQGVTWSNRLTCVYLNGLHMVP